MALTVLFGESIAQSRTARAEGDDLWLDAAELPSVSGWELKSEGACRGDICVPAPRGREAEFVRAGGQQFNLAALAHLLGQPIVRDDDDEVWAFGESGGARREALASLEAPDFTLPDLDGNLHSLLDYRGKKILLVSWASW